MLNPFFLQGSKTEQGLVQDLINEQLKIYGVEIYYIQRQYLTTNNVIAEVIQSEFTHAHPIEAYVNTLMDMVVKGLFCQNLVFKILMNWS